MLAHLISWDGSIFSSAQLRDQIAGLAARGVLKPGQRLPTTREVAVELRINVHTVQQAYDALAEDGVLTIVPGQGSFVSPTGRAEKRP